MSIGTCGWISKTCTTKIVFSKKEFKYEILNHLYFKPKFVFLGTNSGCLTSIYFDFSSSANHSGQANIFTHPPSPPPTTTIKKLPTTLNWHKYFAIRIYFWKHLICLQLAYIFFNCMYILNFYILFKQNIYMFLFSTNIFLSDHFISVGIHVVKLKQVFSIRIYTFQFRISASISWNIFEISQIHILYINWRKYIKY